MIAFKRIEDEYTDRRLAEGGFTLVYYENIMFNYDGSPRDRQLVEDNLWYFRAVGSAHTVVRKLIEYGQRTGKIMIDDYLINHGPGGRGKFFHWQNAMETIRMPETTKHPSKNVALSCIESYPIILKFDRGGRRGAGTFLLREPEDIDTMNKILEVRAERDDKFTGVGTEWLLQEYIPNTGDYRAMVVGDRCIGMYKRRPKKNKVVQSTSSGKSRRFVNNRFPSDVAEVAIAGAKKLGITVCGVDLVRDSRNDEVVAIEFNEAPSFYVFEKRVRVDVPEAIAHELSRRV